MILRKTKPNIEDISVKEIAICNIMIDKSCLDLIGNEIKIIELMKYVSDIFIIHGIDIPENISGWKFFYNHNIPVGQEEVYEDFRINFVERIKEKLPNLMNKIAICELNLDEIKMWMFAPACEYVQKLRPQNDINLVYYHYYKKGYFMKITGNQKSRDRDNIFNYHQKALLTVECLYHFIIINSFDLDIDIKQYLKLLSFKSLSFACFSDIKFR